MQRLLNSLNLCIRAHFSELLNQQEAWFTVGPPAVLNIERVCKGIDHAAFVMTLWVGDPVCAMCEFMDRLNIVMVMLDQFFELCGDCVGPVSDESKRVWSETLSPQCANVDLVPEYHLMDEILRLSDPLKLKAALLRKQHLQRELCRLYRDDIDTAVELLSEHVNQARMLLIA